MHEKIVCKDFEIKNLGEYQDLFLKSDTLSLNDVFGNFRNMCSKIYQLDHVKFLSAQGLAWPAALKKAEVKLELLTDIGMLLMVEKGIRGGIQFTNMQKLITNAWKIMMKIKNHHILIIGMPIICMYGWICMNLYVSKDSSK